jgi:hypothetical protein
MSARVTMFPDKYPRSTPTLDPEKPWRECDRGRVVGIADALALDFLTDAHFVAYHSPDGCRLNSESLGHLDGVEMTCAVFDVDCPETHGTSDPAPEAWRREIRRRVVSLAIDYPDPFYYETRGGARFLYTLAEQTILRTKEDAAAWGRDYLVTVAHFERNHGIAADPSCHDWQRLYRLPSATRTAGGRPERWMTWGEWSKIGSIVVNASREDVKLAKSRTTAFRSRKPRALVASGAGGDGLFYHLLRARGDVGREVPRGGWIALCPNRAEHTSNTDGSDSTIVVPPEAGGETGLIRCKHAHCDRRFTVAEWLKFFTDSELVAARRAAGITTIARTA